MSAFTPEDVARVTLELVHGDFHVANLISRDLEAGFGHGSGSTVKVRVPGATEAFTKSAANKTTALSSGEVIEQTIDVTLDDFVYSNVILSESELQLGLKDYARQVLSPQARAVSAYVERAVCTAIEATTVNTTIAYDVAKPAKTFTAMRSALRANKVSDQSPLRAVIGLNVESALMDADEHFGYDADGRVRQVEVIASNRVDADSITMFCPEAFGLVVRAGEVPQGAPFGASVRDNGFALRVIRSYDGSVAADRSLVSALVKVTPLPLARVIETGEDAGTVELVAGAGAVRVLTDDTEPA